MRQILSTALVAVIVGALAGVTAGTLAQAEPGSAVEPTAKVRNADRVDGKHAVAYTNKRGVRAGKLVATNARGLLPSNIVQPYWGYIKNKPGILADHQIHWNEIVGKPASAEISQSIWWPWPSSSKQSLSRLRSSPIKAHCLIGLVSPSILISIPLSPRLSTRATCGDPSSTTCWS